MRKMNWKFEQRMNLEYCYKKGTKWNIPFSLQLCVCHTSAPFKREKNLYGIEICLFHEKHTEQLDIEIVN